MHKVMGEFQIAPLLCEFLISIWYNTRMKKIFVITICGCEHVDVPFSLAFAKRDKDAMFCMSI